MNVILLGATGMVGQGVLLECLDSSDVRSVCCVGRKSTEMSHPKLTEVLHSDLYDMAAIKEGLQGFDACFFCLGVSVLGMSEKEYHRITFDLTVSVAGTLLRLNPQIVFCYVSGAGTDSTEKGRAMWARVKGKTENRLMEMPFRATYMFRPGYIQPLRGIKSKTRLYRVLYLVLAPFYPLFGRLFPSAVTDTQKVGRAMIRVVRDGGPSRVLEARDINRFALAMSKPS